MATRSRPSGLQVAGSSELPAYQPPEFSMSQAAQRALSAYSHGSKLSNLDKQLKQAQELLTQSAADLNDRLTIREAPLKRRKLNTQQKDEDAAAGPSSLNIVEQKVADLKTRVDKMTQRLDDHVRSLIDARQNINIVNESLVMAANDARNTASTQISTQPSSSQRRLRGDASQSAEDVTGEPNGAQPPSSEQYPDFEPTDPAGATPEIRAPIDVLRESIKKERARYDAKPLAERYAENETYRNFRSIVHDARHPDDDVQLPPVSQWFAEDGSLIGITQVYAANDAELEGDLDEEDDLVVDRTVTSLKCPLTLQEFKHPLSSKKCRHSFEKTAILEMIHNSTVHVPPQPGHRGGAKAVQCPASGCSQLLSAQDLFTDKVLLRKLDRLRRTQEMGGEDEDMSGAGAGGVTIDEVID